MKVKKVKSENVKGFRKFGLVLFVLAVTPLFGQSVNPAKLKINGVVGLDSTYAQVIKLFGRPRKETKPVTSECTGDRERSVEYNGLSFYFADGPGPSKKTFLVMSFDLTSPKYTVSGVKVGDTEAVVKSKFGNRYTVDTDTATGEKTWRYDISERNGGPGGTTVTFKNGKVVSIGSGFLLC